MALLNFIKSLVTEKEGLKEYREKFSAALSDSRLSDAENKQLEEIKQKYGLTSDEVSKLNKAGISSVYAGMTSDQRITTEEKEALEVLLNHFSVQVKDINFDQNAFNKYYCLALIEKGVLPKIDNGNHNINVIFKNDEILHFAGNATLRKLKRVTTRVNYSGLTSSIRIMKGLRYRVGSVKVASESKEMLAAEDTGAYFITNQRVGYLGARKQFSVPINKISSFELRSEGMYIFKDGKETPYILTLEDYEVPSAIVSYILNSSEK